MTERVCPDCDTSNVARANFCFSCGHALDPGGERIEVRKVVTLLMIDIVGSTNLGERLDPESLRVVLNSYFDTVSRVVVKHGGRVEKFIGDAVSSVFGIPLVHEDDALRAARAALEIGDELEKLNAEFRARWDIEVEIRTSLNTGEVVAGAMGSKEGFVTGEPVQVAIRLQRQAAPGEIIVGETTRLLIRDHMGIVPVVAQRDAWQLVDDSVADELHGRQHEDLLIGRATELDLLRGLFELAESSRKPHLVTVLGPAGQGKSRLARELAAEMAGRAIVLKGRCLPYGETSTLGPLGDMVAQAANLDPGDDVQAIADKIRRLLTESAIDGDIEAIVRRAAAVLTHAGSAGNLQEIFWAARKVLHALSNRGPVMLIFDDIHWADDGLLDFVEHLSGSSKGFPLLLLCLAREELLEARPDWGTERSTRMSLPPLDEIELHELVRSLLEGSKLEAQAMVQIARTAQGNPLFVREILRMLADDQVLVREPRGWVVTRPLITIAVPPSIHALMGARLDRLDPQERMTLQRAAVIGPVFTELGLAALIDESSVDLGLVLTSLLQRELLLRQNGSEEIHFSHVLLRDAAYRSLPKELRALLHERYASWLEGSSVGLLRDHEEAVGHHLERAHSYRRELGARSPDSVRLARRAALRLAEAGRRATARIDMPAASSLLERALALTEVDDITRVELLLDLAFPLRQTGRRAEARASVKEALRLAEHHQDRRLRARATLAECFAGDRHPGWVAEARAEVKKALAEFEEIGDHTGLSIANLLAADFHRGVGKYVAAGDAARRALAHAEQSGDERAREAALRRIAWSAVFGPTPVDEALAVCEDVARSSTLLGLEANCLLGRGVLLAMKGEHDSSAELAAAGRDMLTDLGAELQLAHVPILYGLMASFAHDWPAAEKHLREAMTLLMRWGSDEPGAELAWASSRLARAVCAQERFDEAEEITLTSQRSVSSSSVITQADSRSIRARCLARSGRLQEAQALAREAEALASGSDDLASRADILVDLADVARLSDRSSEALDALGQAETLWRLKGMTTMADWIRDIAAV